ncbi:MAG TPA: type IX secretion system sortase PorU [Bacteroidia bacterium]|nr:type IX secretion system sortase PorU [Bacteroidia bacterium]
MKSFKSTLLTTGFLLIFCAAGAQDTVTVSQTLHWKMFTVPEEQGGKTFLTFDNATPQNVAPYIPGFSYSIAPGYPAEVSAEVIPVATEDILPHEWAGLATNDFDYTVTPKIIYYTQNRQPAAKVVFVPLVREAVGGKVKKIVSFTLKVIIKPAVVLAKGSYSWQQNSVLAAGDWIKIPISKTGMYKMDIKYLNKAGLNAEGKDISSLRLYGLGGAMLPQASDAPKTDDLIENAIDIRDVNLNGLFDGNDFILFYGEAAGAWEFNYTTLKYSYGAHKYSDENYYYLAVGANGGVRVADQASETATHTYTTSVFDHLYYYEKDNTNLLKSGREWYGEEFDRVTSYDFTVDIPDLETAQSIRIRSEAIARSQSPSRFTTIVNGQTVLTQDIKGIPLTYEGDYIDTPYPAEDSFTSTSGTLNIKYTYNKPPGAKGWLNYFEIWARRKMRFTGGQVIFSDSKNLGINNVTEFLFDPNGQNVTIWEVTNPLKPYRQATTQSGSQLRFVLSTPTLRRFVAFNDNQLMVPSPAEKITNQNLHALQGIEMVIVTHPDFKGEADRLAKHHEDNDNLIVAVVTPKEIYNEFSSGKQDVSAIRNFLKMLYDRGAVGGDSLRYLLMFGDASYDYKDRLKNNTNFVPTYQSRNTYNPVFSYCSDDFFTHLDDNEGEWIEDYNDHETIDIGIGRFPVQTADQAKQMVDKVIGYSKQETYNDWRNSVTFIADDEDSDQHFRDAQSFAGVIESQNPEFTVDKVYMDAFKQVSLGSGTRYPEVVDIFNRKVTRGALVINYNGHGGEQGLAHEQVLDVPMINNWSNTNLPMFVTATCEFSRFDDPGRTSAGELVLLNPNGGGIGLLTTVRMVYAWPNSILNKAIYSNNMFARVNGEWPRLGDIFRKAKNAAIDLNNRNFTLLGDPAVMLNYPEEEVITTEINGVPAGSSDTVGALSKVTIKGEVRDRLGNKLTNFNGLVYPTVFDKQSKLTTLGNDPGSTRQAFYQYKNIIYKGKASVKDGEFEFSFIVPQDISYIKGHARISYYATDYKTDANGIYDSLMVTGTDVSAPADQTGPTIKLYMNDTTFKFGGVTNQNPTLLALVTDLHGINTTGNGVGRDITAILDNDRSNMLILNDYYQSGLNSYQSGEIRFPLHDLSNGRHSIKVKVWDVYNNSAEGYTEFVVASSDKLAVKHLINYPNPVSGKTTFYFEHNKQGQEMFVDVDIMTMNGQLIKTLTAHVPEAAANFDGLEWDITGEPEENIKQGIYLFRVKVRCGNDTEILTEKMVVIK